jgi:small-conductance mechanosensitive channel
MSRELQGAEPGSAASANILKVIVLLRRAGWWGFTIQVILTVIAAVILAQAFFTITIVESGKGNPGLGPGLSLASIGLLLACANVFWMYWYTRLAKKLGAVNGDRRDRPSKASTLNQVKIGVYISLLGIALALLGGIFDRGGVIQ